IGDAQRLVIGLDLDDRRDRREDLLAIDAHVVPGANEQRRRQIVALGVAVEELAAPGKLGIFLAPDVEIFEVLGKLALIDNRSNLSPILERMIDLERLDRGDNLVDKGIMDLFPDDEA